MMQRVFRAGDSLVVALPDEAIDLLGLEEGSEVEVAFDGGTGQVRFSRPEVDSAGIDAAFAQQLDVFIAHYRPALVALAR
jgi:hypothetical protein